MISQPAALIGQTLLLRYAERGPVETPKGSRSASGGLNVGGDFGLGFSVIPREKSLHIVGILETDPGIGPGGFGRGRMFIPLQLAQRLKPVQVTELRDLMRASLSSATPIYSSPHRVRVERQASAGRRRCRQTDGFPGIFPA